MCDAPSSREDLISQRLAPVMAAAAERIHYAEARRANYTVMAAALVAAGITILTFAIGTIDVPWVFVGAVFSAATMIAAGARVLYIFGQQTNRYPFTAATKTWKWFYRDALPNAKAFDLQSDKSWDAQETVVQKEYANQLPAFQKTMEQLSDSLINLQQDVQQAYVLHITEKYKNIYLSQLRSLFNRSLIWIAGATVLGMVAGAAWGAYEGRIVESSSSNGSWAQEIEYRQLSSPLADSKLWSIRAAITNLSDHPITLQKVVAIDAEGWPLPAEVANSIALPHVVRPRQSIEVFTTLGADNVSSWDLNTIQALIR